MPLSAKDAWLWLVARLLWNGWKMAYPAYIGEETNRMSAVLPIILRRPDNSALDTWCARCAVTTPHSPSRLDAGPGSLPMDAKTIFVCTRCHASYKLSDKLCGVPRCGLPAEKIYTASKGVIEDCPVHGPTSEAD